MNGFRFLLLITFMLTTLVHASTQDTPVDSLRDRLREMEQQRITDSIQRVQLLERIDSVEALRKLRDLFQSEIRDLGSLDTDRLKKRRAQIDSMRATTPGHPVLGIRGDTLFYVYTKSGAATAAERARQITEKLQKLIDDDFLRLDSLILIPEDGAVDISYKGMIVMNISETDALWNNSSTTPLAETYLHTMREDIRAARDENSIYHFMVRIALVLFIIACAWGLLNLITRAHDWFIGFIDRRRYKLLHSLSYKDYTFLTEDQEYHILLFLMRIFKWIFFGLILYIAFPLVFSVFPFTRGWADKLFKLIWTPLRGVFVGIWNYLPNLFSILAILLVMYYVNRFVKYLFSEIQGEKLKINWFHADWAMPTYSIVRFLLYAFTFVLIFPYLPGSDSSIFQGVSVFIGLLISLGSTSAIANMVAGLVITYMRPYRIGDRIKVGDVVGDVVEKTLLVTRLRTPKNEEITIPNSAILQGNTVNYSTYAREEGVIVYTSISIGYAVPWRDVHQALLDAAAATPNILQEPKPFVLQSSLDDFYVTYQINAYTAVANKLAKVYSDLHQNIQDICQERNIEITSPHYQVEREMIESTIPPKKPLQ